MAATTDAPPRAVRVLLLSGGVSNPSSSRLLTDRLAAQLHQVLTAEGESVTTTTLELAPLAVDVATKLVGGLPSPALTAACQALADADVIIAGTPIYKAGISGLFKSFLDTLDNDLLLGKVVALTATAGTARHALVVDDHLRPLFAFMRAVTVPTSVFAAPEDWADPGLASRLRRAAREVLALHRAGLADEVKAHSWAAYQHSFTGIQEQRDGGGPDLDFDTPLMRLAAGGQ
jgi:FMN reductase